MVVAHSPAYLFAAATRVVMVVWSLFFPLGSDPILIGSFSGFKLLLSKPVVLALFSGVDGSSATRVFVLFFVMLEFIFYFVVLFVFLLQGCGGSRVFIVSSELF